MTNFESTINYLPPFDPLTVRDEDALSSIEPAAFNQVEAGPQESGFKKALTAAKYAVHSTVVLGEISPANEALRYGALAGVLTQTSNPLMGALVLGGTTALVEGGAAISTSHLLASGSGSKAITFTNNLLEKPFIRKFVPTKAKMSPTIEAGVAMTTGSSIVTILKQREDPNRTLEQNRRYGIFMGSWMGGVFALEGAAIAKGVESYHDPKTLGFALIALGGIHAATRWAKNKAENVVSYKNLSIVESVPDYEGVIQRSIERYQAFRNLQDEEVKVGLYAEDLDRAFNVNGAKYIKYETRRKEEAFCMPFLMPLEKLDWYNHDYISKKYGEETPIYYFAHPLIPDNDKERAVILDEMKSLLDSGAVIISDIYTSDNTFEALADSLNRVGSGSDVSIEVLGDPEEKRAEVYIGEVLVNERLDSEPEKHLSLYEAYRHGIESGELSFDPDSGTSMEQIITDEDIEATWIFYSDQFDLLSEGHPTLAGFDKDAYISIMKDPSYVKLVQRSGDRIVSIAVAEEGLELSPWFNAPKYQRDFPDYAEDQILTWPAIVSDPDFKGGVSSLKLFDLTARVLRYRGKNVIITSECTETSAKYIPMLVRRSVRNMPDCEITGMKEPVSVTRYKAMRKA